MNTVPPVLQRPGTTKIARRNRKIFIFLAILIALAAVGAFLVFGKRTPPIIIQSEKVSRRGLTEIVVANGTIQPVVEVSISPEVSGEIIDLPVKEGQRVKKGDLLVKINPDVYIAALDQAKAGYEAAVATQASSQANLEKAKNDYDRNQKLYNTHLLDESDFDQFKMARDQAKAQLDSAKDQVAVQKAAVDSAQASLDKTTIYSPLDGTVSQLNSQLGERVLGTIQNEGTEIMIVSDLNKMEARVNVGEMDVVGVAPGQKATLDVDSFKDRKFTGVVTEVASSSVGNNLPAGQSSVSSASGTGQEATKFEVRIRINNKEQFRPGMSVSADIETIYRTNVLTVPLASVTTRSVAQKADPDPPAKGSTNSIESATNSVARGTNSAAAPGGEASKLTDVVFVVEGDRVKAVPVTIGICDDNYWEITGGLTNGEEIVSGGYKAISRDLQDGSKIKKGLAVPDAGAQK